MLKFLTTIAFSLCSLASYGANAQEQLSKYLYTLGQYLGYDLNGYPQGNTESKEKANVSQKLLSYNDTDTAQKNLVDSFLKALLVNTAGISTLIPSTSSLATINTFANFIFANPNYSSPNTDENVSVNPLIDQNSYQMDPVSQAVLNIVATPDLSYCFDNSNQLEKNCSYKTQAKVMVNVLGNPPAPDEAFSYDYNKAVLSQLNSNSLLGPLMYSTTNPNQNSTSSSPLTPSTNQGLTAQTQAEEAANFIRYAIGAVNPINLVSKKDYETAFNNMTLDSGNNQESSLKNEVSLLTYLTGLRVFAAQNSIGISNLYSILAKRMPQSTKENTLTSQALTEFNMATWRLDSQKQWTKKIDQASAATVQKEMATLLAEINYQLYLSRQQQERILLTNSMLLLQNARLNQPEGLSNANTGK